MTFSKESLDLAAEIIAACSKKDLRLATAESCTGGLISACLTEVSGSSAVIDRGFVTYSNEAKQDLLGVPSLLIEQYGAVSKEVACAMAKGAQLRAGVDLAVAVTGIAGPTGGSANKPVGLVHRALSFGGDVDHVSEIFAGQRRDVREATLRAVLEDMIKAIT